MNTSQLMDKQIRDLSNSKNNNDFIALMNTQEDHIGTGKIHDIEPSYDFQQPSQQTNLDSNGVFLTRVWNSAVSKTNNAGITGKVRLSAELIVFVCVSFDDFYGYGNIIDWNYSESFYHI